MRRRFITRQDIDDLATAGETVLTVDDHITVTDIAREHARDRGVRIVRGEPSRPVTTDVAPGSDTHRASLGDEVRAAVVARVGHEPDGLDDAVTAVLSRRGS